LAYEKPSPKRIVLAIKPSSYNLSCPEEDIAGDQGGKNFDY